jgi:dihydropteroate synthase
MDYIRPIVMTDPARPSGALRLAGGWCWFTDVEVLRRDARPRIIPAADLDAVQRARLTDPRADFGGVGMDAPRIMGILNVTPDSFSDGGRFADPAAAVAQVQDGMADADILDIGGESTRPGADVVDPATEIARTVPVIAAIRASGDTGPISIDTRKAAVAAAALAAGAGIVNDVSAMGFDAGMAAVVAQSGAPVVLMHAQGVPQTMQADPRYDDVVLDVYDFLAFRIDAAVAVGIARDRIAVDPGIGFGKTTAHNLALLTRLSLFHSLGCPILLGASRKRFIGTISGAAAPDARLPGSLAVALAGVAQGVQMVRVHDVAETRAALALWQAINGGKDP